jgi:hypothetical protein
MFHLFDYLPAVIGIVDDQDVSILQVFDPWDALALPRALGVMRLQVIHGIDMPDAHTEYPPET